MHGSVGALHIICITIIFISCPRVRLDCTCILLYIYFYVWFYYFHENMGNKSMPKTHASNIFYDVQDTGRQSSRTFGVIMTSLFEYMDRAHYSEIMS